MIQFPDLHQSDVEWHEFDWSEYLVEQWVGGRRRAVNDLVRPSVANGYFYKCTTEGLSAAREPNWPKINGATVSDGSAVFTAQTPTDAAEPTISAHAYVFTPSGELVEALKAIDNNHMTTRVRIDATGARLGLYEIEATITTSSGEDFVLKAKLRVIA